MSRETIFSEIKDERIYQDGKWGTKFDDQNTYNDWMSYVCMYLSDGGKMINPQEKQRVGLVKAASLCVAALEAFDRNNGMSPRHYDSKPVVKMGTVEPIIPERTNDAIGVEFINGAIQKYKNAPEVHSELIKYIDELMNEHL